ncbi:hypothetical protein [Streptomyces phage Psst4]|nr:hypothetical protein [Streptomyces phage Psst4]
MNEKLNKLKSKIKKHLPEIATVAALVAAASYAFYSKGSPQTEEEPEEHKTFRIALNDCCFEELKSGDSVFWKFDNATIDLAYDPDC